MIEGAVPDEIREGPDAIRATIRVAGPAARDVAGRWRANGIRRVHVIGNGTSFHSCLASATATTSLNSPDDEIPTTASRGPRTV